MKSPAVLELNAKTEKPFDYTTYGEGYLWSGVVIFSVIFTVFMLLAVYLPWLAPIPFFMALHALDTACYNMELDYSVNRYTHSLL